MRGRNLQYLLWTIIFCAALGAGPSSDSTVDWLMNQATTAPTTRASVAATQPAAFSRVDESRLGEIVMSDGRTIRGRIATTAEKPIRVWVEADKEYQDVPFALIRSIEARVLWERDEPEWRFKASGSDVKELSGKTYPARETVYALTLNDGAKIEGGVVAPLYVTAEGQTATTTFVLHKRDKGEPGKTLAQLVFVKRVRFVD